MTENRHNAARNARGFTVPGHPSSDPATGKLHIKDLRGNCQPVCREFLNCPVVIMTKGLWRRSRASVLIVQQWEHAILSAPEGDTMLLTITHTGENTANIGFLFHKNPARPQVFDLNYGSAFVFYPEVSAEKTTIALLLAIVKFRLFINLFNKQIRLSFLRMRMLFTPTAQTPISSLPTPD